MPNIGNRNRVTDAERLNDIMEKLNRWGYLSHHPEAECDMAWLLQQLDKREADIARLEGRVEKSDWILLAPVDGSLDICEENGDRSTLLRGQLRGCDFGPIRQCVLDGLLQRHRPALGPG